MSKLILFNAMTVDGFFEGPNKEIDWHNVGSDGEFNEFAIEQLNSADLLIFGRVTYEMMASYWPTPEGVKDDPVIAQKMNSIPKIVFSRTLDVAAWQNTIIVREKFDQKIKELKHEKSKDLFIFGSADLASSFRRLNLIDEYRVMLSPVLLGKGNPLFKEWNTKLHLKLLKIKEFKSGNVLLIYKPVKHS
jgi:dihydrofolate reductase